MRAINPKDTTRAYAFEMWMQAPMPMVTFFKTLDVSRLVRISPHRGLKFNMLMCYCIGRAAGKVAYSCVGNKYYYQIAEIKRCLKAHIIKSSDEMLDDLIQRSGYNPRR